MIRRIMVFALLCIALMTACTDDGQKASPTPNEQNSVAPTITVSADIEQTSKPEPEDDDMTITISVGAAVFTATLYDTDAAHELQSMLPMTISMSELNRNEKYFYLSETLTTESKNVGDIKAGDLML